MIFECLQFAILREADHYDNMFDRVNGHDVRSLMEHEQISDLARFISICMESL